MIHELKSWPEPFELIRLGVKTCEVRNEVDGRRFGAGDVLVLREFDPRGLRGYTGRSLRAHVTHLSRCSDTPQPWQLQAAGGIVVMSLRVVEGGELT